MFLLTPVAILLANQAIHSSEKGRTKQQEQLRNKAPSERCSEVYGAVGSVAPGLDDIYCYFCSCVAGRSSHRVHYWKKTAACHHVFKPDVLSRRALTQDYQGFLNGSPLTCSHAGQVLCISWLFGYYEPVGLLSHGGERSTYPMDPSAYRRALPTRCCVCDRYARSPKTTSSTATDRKLRSLQIESRLDGLASELVIFAALCGHLFISCPYLNAEWRKGS